MVVDKKKLERQYIGVDRWFNSSLYGALFDKQGTYNYATGVGKTYTAILVIKRLFRTEHNHNIVIIVPSEALLQQWKVELGKHFTKKELNRIEVFTVHWVALNKVKIKTNTLIVDELHEYLGDEFYKVIDGTYIQYDNNLGLTATYEDSKKRHLKLKSFYPIVDKITEEEAIAEGYISPFIEFNLAVELTQKEQEDYAAYTTVISNNINKFGRGGLELATKCLSGGVHKDGKRYTAAHFVYGWAGHKGWTRNLNLDNPQDAEIDALWNPHLIFGYAQKLLNAIRFRKNILYNCSSKIEVIKALTLQFNDLKTIVFSQSTNFADKLNLLLNEQEENSSVVYHSKLATIMLPSPKTGKLIKCGKTRLKRQAIERITTGQSRIICTASSLDKGFDVQDMSLGVTASGTSNFTQYKQRGGRVKRKDIFNVNNVVLLINLYVKDSKDEIWLKKRQSTSTHIIHWVDSINDVSFTPRDRNEFTINDI